MYYCILVDVYDSKKVLRSPRHPVNGRKKRNEPWMPSSLSAIEVTSDCSRWSCLTLSPCCSCSESNCSLTSAVSLHLVGGGSSFSARYNTRVQNCTLFLLATLLNLRNLTLYIAQKILCPCSWCGAAGWVGGSFPSGGCWPLAACSSPCRGWPCEVSKLQYESEIAKNYVPRYVKREIT